MLTKSVAMAIATVMTFAYPALAADASGSASAPAAAVAPLAPGQAAGVKSAQDFSSPSPTVIAGGLAVLGVGIALIANHGDHSSMPSSSTGSTSTTGTH